MHDLADRNRLVRFWRNPPAANCSYSPDSIDNMISKQFVQICCMLNGVALLHRLAKG